MLKMGRLCCFFVNELNQFVTAALHRHVKVRQHSLEQNTVAAIVLITESGPDGLKRKLACSVKCNRKAIALHQGAGDDTRVGVACTRIVRGQVRTGDFPVLVIKATIGINRRLFVITNDRHAGDNHNFRTPFGELFEILL